MDQPIVQTKRCCRCEAIKAVSDFYKNGKDDYCKPCRKQVSADYYRQHHKEQRERIREYNNSPVGKEAHSRYRQSDKGRATQARHREKDRASGKYPARRAVHVAIAKGHLQPARSHLCAYCQQQAAEWHHHQGYDPKHHLDVVPLCVSCHKLADAK